MPRKSTPLIVQIARHTRVQPKPTGKDYEHLKHDCVVFTGPPNPPGNYARIRLNGEMKYLHRSIWEEVRGPIPQDKEVGHKCDVRLCCEITHLELCTHQQNIAGAKARGRTGKKITPQTAALIKGAFKNEPTADIAKTFPISEQMIRNIKEDRSWSYVAAIDVLPSDWSSPSGYPLHLPVDSLERLQWLPPAPVVTTQVVDHVVDNEVDFAI